ncbi:pre-toxin TG domain-containing protein [Lysinibacillus sp. 3P01SB]|uniref:pre-toxin TG domain-containing protein n=1 Tax=Lysinibacillus sp. 3P01SB TaxID=3132284 RepID=UPI0039A5205B
MDLKQAISTVADFIPVVSNAKAIYEATVGKDPFTGRKLEAWERGASAASILGGPIVKGIKHGGKAAAGIIKNSGKSTKKPAAATKPKDTTTPSQKKQENKPKPNTTPAPAGNKKQTTSTPQNGNKPAAAKQQGTDKNTIKGTGKGVPKPVSIDEAKGIARTKIAQERNELLEGKYIDPNTGDIYIPHVMTAAVNLKTGRAYIGYNGKGFDFRTGNERFNPTVSELDDEVVMLVEKTKNRALEASKQAGGEVKDSFEKWTVDNCAEVQAVNQAVKDGAKVEDILLSTIEVLPNKYKKVCKNCKETFENFFIDNFK